MSLECEYCKKNYSSKSNLTNHQKTAKYCLKIQSELGLSNNKQKSYNCQYCNKKFSSNQRLNYHLETCVDKYENIINENQKLKDHIIELETENRLLRENFKENQSTINEIAKQPRVATTTNNHNKIMINTPIDLSQSTVQQAIQNGFSEDYLMQGQKGVARFAYDNILKDEQGKLKYICTDASRQIFQFKNEDGSIQKDVKATKLTKALLEGELKSASHKMACDKMKDGSAEEFNMYTDNYYNIKDLETDNSDFSKELTTLTT